MCGNERHGYNGFVAENGPLKSEFIGGNNTPAWSSDWLIALARLTEGKSWEGPGIVCVVVVVIALPPFPPL